MSTQILSPGYLAAVFAHTAATVAKTFYLINARVLLALNDAAVDEDNVFVIEAHNILAPKPGDEAWDVGDTLYWDNTGKNFTIDPAAGANTKCGYAVAPAATADTEGKIRLMQFP